MDDEDDFDFDDLARMEGEAQQEFDETQFVGFDDSGAQGGQDAAFTFVKADPAAPPLGASARTNQAGAAAAAPVAAPPSAKSVHPPAAQLARQPPPSSNLHAVGDDAPPPLRAVSRGMELLAKRQVEAPKLSSFLTSRPLHGSSSIPIALPGGDMFFLELDESALNGEADAHAATAAAEERALGRGCLLAVPIRQLSAKLDREAARSASVAAVDTAAAQHQRGDLEEEAEPGRGKPSGAAEEEDDDDVEMLDAVARFRSKPQSGAAPAQTSLWVDKYAPKRFLDLLSSDQLNRNVVRWIKLWDGRVFGRGGAAGGISKAGKSMGALDLLGGGQQGAGGGKDTGAAHRKKQRGDGAEGGETAGRNPGGAGSDDDEAAAVPFEDPDDRGRKRPAQPASSFSSSSFRGGRGGQRGGQRGGRGGGGGHIQQRGGGEGQERGNGGPPSAPSVWGYGWRPDARVLLFCGPPGMGKTTLAHIAARTTGYRAVEINASDDRSGKSIRERITAAQGMASVFGEKKPTLIILDEIDGIEGGGAAGGGIGELVKMIKATPSLLGPTAFPAGGGGEGRAGTAGDPGNGGDDDAGGEEDGEGGAPVAKRRSTGAAGKKRRAGAKRPGAGEEEGAGGDAEGGGGGGGAGAVQPLTRPLICICNDPYAPALRELRPLVQIVEFNNTSTPRLVARLRGICAAEGLLANSAALTSLAHLTDNDIRSCLNTLQFLRAQVDARGRARAAAAAAAGGGKQPLGSVASASALLLDPAARITTEMIARAAVGIKDQTKALFEVWTAVYTQPDLRRRAMIASLTGGGTGTSGQEQDDIDAMLDSGDLEAGIAAAAKAAAARAAATAGRGPVSILEHPAMKAIAAGRGALGEASGQGRAAYFNELFGTLSGYGSESRLLLSGLEENLNLSRANDPTMEHTWRALDWLCFGEEVVSRVSSTSNFSLMKYVPLAGLGVHLHMSSPLKVRVAWPRSDSAQRNATEQRRNIMSTFLLGRAAGLLSASALSSASGRCFGALGLPAGITNTRSAVLDLLSPLLNIVSPPLRPVGLGLMNSREKAEVEALVQTLLACGLTYVAKTVAAQAWGAAGRQPGAGKSGAFGSDLPFYMRRGRAGEEGQDVTFVLQPEIHSLLEFADYDTYDPELRVPLPDVLKQSIAHEVRLSRIRAMHARAALRENIGGGANGGDTQQQTPTQQDSSGKPKPAAGAVPAHVTAQLAQAMRKAAGTHGAPEAPEARAAAGVELLPTPATARALASSGGMNFLVLAAQKSKQAEASRKRTAMTREPGMHAAAARKPAPGDAAAPPQPAALDVASLSSGSAGGTKYPVVYRYQEGFTNAVRRPVRLRELF